MNFSCKHFAPYSFETLSVTEPGAHRFCLTGNPENSKDPAISSQLLGSQACTIILAFLCGNSEAKLSCLACHQVLYHFPKPFLFSWGRISLYSTGCLGTHKNYLASAPRIFGLEAEIATLDIKFLSLCSLLCCSDLLCTMHYSNLET